MKTLKQTIIDRDNISSSEADQQIAKAKEAMEFYLSIGDFDSAENICQEHFGLEPDFLMELIDL